MTESIYLEVSEKTEAAQKAGRRVSVSGMLKFLGVSRSGYLAWLHHVPSDTEKRRKAVKAKICSAVIRRKLFHRIMHALNPFILLSNVNGSIALKFATISRHTS